MWSEQYQLVGLLPDAAHLQPGPLTAPDVARKRARVVSYSWRCHVLRYEGKKKKVQDGGICDDCIPSHTQAMHENQINPQRSHPRH
jgi:hypothetical protein